MYDFHKKALAALTATRALVSEAAMTGFNVHEGDWAERLYANQAKLSAAIALAANNDNNGWIEWAGGSCPVARGTIVDLRDSDGYVWHEVEALKHIAAADIFWRHEHAVPSHYIVAYRVAS